MMAEIIPIPVISDAMKFFRNNALLWTQDGITLIMEDYRDPDGRIYRLEYHCSHDSRHALALCRFNPWGNTPNAGVPFHIGHISPDGRIDLGRSYFGDKVHRCFDLKAAVLRSRYWCTAFSVLKETGQFPQI